jgi:hypothetical protein
LDKKVGNTEEIHKNPEEEAGEIFQERFTV